MFTEAPLTVEEEEMLGSGNEEFPVDGDYYEPVGVVGDSGLDLDPPL